MRGAPPPSRFLLIVFLAMLATPPLVQTLQEARQGTWPAVFEIVTRRPTPANLRAFEDDLAKASVTARTLRPWMQAVQFFGWRDAGEKALVGRDGWLFYQPGVNYLTQRPAPADSSPGDALAAAVHFRDGLAARGIRLILMPAPNKESVYPERLSRLAAAPAGVLSPETRLFLEQAEAAGLECVDLFALFRQARQGATPPLYLKQDSHWSPEGLALAASALAQRLCPGTNNPFALHPTPGRRLGDLILMLRSPAIEQRVIPEEVACVQVVHRDTQAPYTDDPKSDVLLLGDSFLRIFERDAPRSAGFVAHLAMALGRPVASLVNDGGASTLVRQDLARRPHLLEGKKVVVWEFVERDLRLGTEGWQVIPVPMPNLATTEAERLEP